MRNSLYFILLNLVVCNSAFSAEALFKAGTYTAKSKSKKTTVVTNNESETIIKKSYGKGDRLTDMTIRISPEQQGRFIVVTIEKSKRNLKDTSEAKKEVSHGVGSCKISKRATTCLYATSEIKKSGEKR